MIIVILIGGIVYFLFNKDEVEVIELNVTTKENIVNNNGSGLPNSKYWINGSVNLTNTGYNSEPNIVCLVSSTPSSIKLRISNKTELIKMINDGSALNIYLNITPIPLTPYMIFSGSIKILKAIDTTNKPIKNSIYLTFMKLVLGLYKLKYIFI